MPVEFVLYSWALGYPFAITVSLLLLSTVFSIPLPTPWIAPPGVCELTKIYTSVTSTPLDNQEYWRVGQTET